MSEHTEIVDIVDENDVVIGQATRQETHDQGLLHRAVHVLALDEERNVLLQKRADSKAFNPGCWTSAASGHITTGDTYEATADREAVEELGLPRPLSLKYIGKVRADALDRKTGRACCTWTALYTMRLTVGLEDVRPQASELAKVEVFPFNCVRRAVKGEIQLKSVNGEIVQFADNFAPIFGLFSID